tara:strand:+ start:155 stop:355 length:201 start_codon:yes stop_codon:yes gene_type:complete
MPSGYGGGKSTHNKNFKGMAKMSKSQHEKFIKAEKDGLITRKQHNSLPPQLLEAIIKSKTKAKKKK